MSGDVGGVIGVGDVAAAVAGAVAALEGVVGVNVGAVAPLLAAGVNAGAVSGPAAVVNIGVPNAAGADGE